MVFIKGLSSLLVDFFLFTVRFIFFTYHPNCYFFFTIRFVFLIYRPICYFFFAVRFVFSIYRPTCLNLVDICKINSNIFFALGIFHRSKLKFSSLIEIFDLLFLKIVLDRSFCCLFL